jgi:8-oxo-dGTP pyrophosphatase MutT (NUDIX family)
VIEDWPWLDTPSFVNVVAETEDGHFLCFRQSKYAVEGISLAIPGGYLEPNEEPLAAIQRELREETGYAADQWTFLGRYAVDGNRGNGHAHLFLARGARYIQPIDADDLEEQELVLLTRTELGDALAAGSFKVLPWAANVALALTKY